MYGSLYDPCGAVVLEELHTSVLEEGRQVSVDYLAARCKLSVDEARLAMERFADEQCNRVVCTYAVCRACPEMHMGEANSVVYTRDLHGVTEHDRVLLYGVEVTEAGRMAVAHELRARATPAPFSSSALGCRALQSHGQPTPTSSPSPLKRKIAASSLASPCSGDTAHSDPYSPLFSSAPKRVCQLFC